MIKSLCSISHRSISYVFPNGLILKGKWQCEALLEHAQVKETVSKNLTGSQAAPQRCCSKVPIAFERLYDIEITWK